MLTDCTAFCHMHPSVASSSHWLALLNITLILHTYCRSAASLREHLSGALPPSQVHETCLQEQPCPAGKD